MILVNSRFVEIFYKEFSVAVKLVNPAIVEIFYQEFSAET